MQNNSGVYLGISLLEFIKVITTTNKCFKVLAGISATSRKMC